MRIVKILAPLGLLISQSLLASILIVSPGPRKINNVTVNDGAVVTNLEGQQVRLTSVQAELVTKYVLRQEPAYVAQMYVSDPAFYPLPNNDPLKSIDNPKLKIIAFQMTFLHSASVGQIVNQFKEGFHANQIDFQNNPDLVEAINKVSAAGRIRQGDGTQTLTIVGEHLSNGYEFMRYENSETGVVESLTTHYHGFMRDLLSGWLGNLFDSGRENLKNALTTGGGSK